MAGQDSAMKEALIGLAAFAIVIAVAVAVLELLIP